MYVARIHKVNFNLDPRKHTVYFAREAEQATAEPLKGWAGTGHAKAVIGDTEEQCVERLRIHLIADILAWEPDADLSAFTFNVAFEEVRDGAFWSCFGGVVGTPFKVHEFNPWR